MIELLVENPYLLTFVGLEVGPRDGYRMSAP